MSDQGQEETLVQVPSSLRVLLPDEQTVEMPLEVYLVGAVAAEMGADAPLEALKAQAVASRTYAASIHRHSSMGADVCTAPHCQKWKVPNPSDADVFRAVKDTAGILVGFGGYPLQAFFFEHCDGHTRAAHDLLLPDVPYLTSVECACGFVALKGHGVGMCQRGAIVLAREGASYQEILGYYYRGAQIINTVTGEIELASPALAVEKESPPGAESEEPAVTPQEVSLQEEPPAVDVAPTPIRSADDNVVQESSAGPAQEIVSPSLAPASVEPAPTLEPDAAEAPILGSEIEPTSQDLPQAEESDEGLKIESGETEFAAASAPAEQELELEVAYEIVDLSPQEPSAEEEPPPSEARVAVEIAPAEPVPPVPTSEPPPQPDETVRTLRHPGMHVDHLPGPPAIAGCLAECGVAVSIKDEQGNETLVFTGSAPHYGEGGFEMVVEGDGRFFVQVDDETIEVNVRGDTVFIHIAESKRE